ncbi:MAG: hypothetical protein ABI321_11390 [Polyangia bacterium]
MRTILSALLFSTLALSATARADEAKAAAPVDAAKVSVKPHAKKAIVKNEAKAQAVKNEAKTEVTPVVAKTSTKVDAVKAAPAKVQPRTVKKLRHTSKPKMVAAAPKTTPQPAK